MRLLNEWRTPTVWPSRHEFLCKVPIEEAVECVPRIGLRMVNVRAAAPSPPSSVRPARAERTQPAPVPGTLVRSIGDARTGG